MDKVLTHLVKKMSQPLLTHDIDVQLKICLHFIAVNLKEGDCYSSGSKMAEG